MKKDKEKILNNNLHNKKYKLKYITGNSALNIPYNGIQCDWHQVNMLKSSNYLIHPINYIGAEYIFDTYGLWDCSSWFLSKGIKKRMLCATPIRAIVDKLYYNLVILNTYPSTLDLNELILEGINIIELKGKIKILKENLNSNQQKLLIEWENKNEI